jgi:hypothetical protein
MASYYFWYFVLLTSVLIIHTSYLSRSVGINQAITHPGTILLGFFYLYCIVPLLFFATNTIEGAPFRWDIYSDQEIKSHLNRSIIFAIALFISIHFLSKRRSYLYSPPQIKFDFLVVLICLSVFIASNSILIFLSAPVSNYYDFYTRFDHLGGALQYVSVFCKRLSWGITPITLFVLSVYFQDNSKKYVASVFLVIIFILINSYGARIDAILAVLQAVTYRMIWRVKPLNRTQILATVPVIALMIYGLRYIEIIRLGSDSGPRITLETALLAAPGEFFALMFPSIELYRILPTQSLPSPIYYIKDFLAILPFYDTTKFDLMHWYWKTFAPQAPVAPFTMGILAEPALLGSWWLIVQAFVIGRLAIIINNLRFSSDPYRLAAFGYLASTGVLVLKYNMLTYIDMLINNFIPGAIVLWFVLRVIKRYRFENNVS